MFISIPKEFFVPVIFSDGFILNEEEIPMLKSFFDGQSQRDLELNVNYVLNYNKKLEESK